MTTFYNAGYTKADIEEAAAAYQTPVFAQPGINQRIQQPPQQAPQITQQKTQDQVPVPQVQPLIPTVQQGVVQRVSEYGQSPEYKKPSRTGMAITIILTMVLLLLIGVLVGVILFKDELSDFFNNLFWRGLL